MGGRGSSGGGTDGSYSNSKYGFGKTIKVGNYEIVGGMVKSPSGRSSMVESFSEISEADRKKYEKMGVKDPVKSGNMILPRGVAEESARQVQYQKNLMQKNVPGLSELRKARNYDENQRELFKKSVYSGSGIIKGSPSSQTSSALAKKYKRASDYLKAEAVSYSINPQRSAIGKKAMYAIANGKSSKKAISEMQRELTQLAKKDIWD